MNLLKGQQVELLGIGTGDGLAYIHDAIILEYHEK
jgi:hypothetical protein